MKRNLHERYVVKVSESAFLQMILSAMEAYCVYHKINKRSGKICETYGILWGNAGFTCNGRKFFNIELLSIDTSAEKSSSYCIENDESFQLKNDFITSFYPTYEFLGDFHTHPYKSKKPKAVHRNKLYNFSKEDIETVVDKKFHNHKYRIGIVLAITSTGKSTEKISQFPGGVEFSLNNYRLFLNAQILRASQIVENEFVDLYCPTIFGLKEVIKFGKWDAKQRKHIIADKTSPPIMKR